MDKADTPRHESSRREFLAAAAGLLPALALSYEGTLLDFAPAPPDPAGSELPPRVVGLRSLGGAFRFDPVGLLIEPGDTVSWLNMGDFHTATSFHPENGDLLPDGVPRRVPDGAEAWHSGMLGLTAGTEFQHTFQVEGVHDYFCQPHYGFGMVGRIVVGGSRDGPAARRGLEELPEAAREEIPPVEAVTGPAGRIFEWIARVNGVLWLMNHDDDPGPSTQALSRGIEADEELRALLEASGQEPALGDRLASLRDGVTGGLGYEALFQRADALKGVLRDALPSGPGGS